jgi:hypothetical protein
MRHAKPSNTTIQTGFTIFIFVFVYNSHHMMRKGTTVFLLHPARSFVGRQVIH